MLRRLILFLLILFLVVSVPLGTYLWARNAGRPTPFTLPSLGINGTTPQGVSRGSQPVRLADLQNMPVPLADPMTDDDCFFENAYTCLYNNVSTTSGKLQIQLENPPRPDTRLSLGYFWGYPGALQQHYQFGLANGGKDSEPIFTSVQKVLDEGSRNRVNPMLLLAYYDFLLAEAKALDISPQEVGLPLSDAFPLSPEPTDVASTFRVALQLFPENIDVFGQPLEQQTLGVQDDELSSWLKQQPLTQSGRALIYTTSQLFGTEFASQIFTKPEKFYHHYNKIFRDPRLSGTFTLQRTATPLNPFEYFYRDPSLSEVVLCDDVVALSCPYVFDETTPGGEAQLNACSPVPFFNEFCSQGILQDIE